MNEYVKGGIVNGIRMIQNDGYYAKEKKCKLD